ncbi:hypothetical protein BKA70DRAFT_349685 [Coprinopsis sp. MPI-PUGE-AT-0042]|nr:hypothetical protein BKA70DRAFT_349685 [Coprinopsis sp. MPI-PUGE-AT-0042]
MRSYPAVWRFILLNPVTGHSARTSQPKTTTGSLSRPTPKTNIAFWDNKALIPADHTIRDVREATRRAAQKGGFPVVARMSSCFLFLRRQRNPQYTRPSGADEDTTGFRSTQHATANRNPRPSVGDRYTGMRMVETATDFKTFDASSGLLSPLGKITNESQAGSGRARSANERVIGLFRWMVGWWPDQRPR